MRCRSRWLASAPSVRQPRSRTIRSSAVEGEWASGLVSPVRRNPHLLYSAIAGLLVAVTQRQRPLARRARAQAITASTRATPTPRPRHDGPTNIPDRTGRVSFGSSGSLARPVTSPIHSPSRSAINVERSAPEAPPSARSRHTCSGNASSRDSVEPNAIGASARADRRRARNFAHSSGRIRRTSGPRACTRYSITWSARPSSDCGIVRPSAFAVLRLMTSSNVVGSSIGKSPGFAPFRTLSTYRAARRNESLRLGA
jgi:hypothetical protein